MKTRLLKAVLIGALSMSCTTMANAALISRMGGQAYYDDVLDITWLANANLAATNTFGVSGINAKGKMSWDTANAWIAAMNNDGGAGYLGINDWRLPTLSPIDGSNFDSTFTNNATSDRGSATSAGWVDGDGNPVSEMGYMYYANLGNLGRWTPNDSHPHSRTSQQPGWGLANTGPFLNLQPGRYWSGVEWNENKAWRLSFRNGKQSNGRNKSEYMYAWAVHSGDIAAVPVPAAAWLFGSGLMALLGIKRRR